MKKNTIKTLSKILILGEISDTLREAISETVTAIRNDDMDLAYQLTACKSLIVGKLTYKPAINKFRENESDNETKLGESVYSLLGSIHFDTSFHANRMPAGMMVVGVDNNGKCVHSEMESKGIHPIVKRIIHEKKVIASR